MEVFGRGDNILETRKFLLGGSGGFLLASPGSRERPLTFCEFLVFVLWLALFVP